MTYTTTLTKSDTAYILRTLQESLSQTYPPDSLTSQALDTAYAVLLYDPTIETETTFIEYQHEDPEDQTQTITDYQCIHCGEIFPKMYKQHNKSRILLKPKYCPLCGAKTIWP